ncbi:MAG: efflux RND transporter periplasmic adaptor subunit, partial [Armatimonadetes bacterium]|nr:efflux RND transporter periplasmic adaptor subunit [Armatimonadota bacterium]
AAERIAGRVGDGSARTSAEARVSHAETALAEARAARERLEGLLPDGLATAQELGAARTEESEARADLEAARRELRVIDTPSDEARLTADAAVQEVAAAQAALTEAQARLELATARHHRAEVVAGEALPSRQGTAEAETEVAVARAAFEQARRAWEREERLHRGDVRSRDALADAEGAVAGARARERAAERMAHVLSQGRGRAGGRVSLVAPVSGRISARGARVGAMAEAGTPLLEIIGARSIWVEAAFYEKDLPRLAPGQPMRVEATAFPGRVLETTVYSVDPALDEHTRKAKVRGLLDNPRGALRPDMLAQVAIRVGVITQALAVPAEAVQSDGDCEFIFVEEHPGRYRRVEVETGARGGKWIEVLGGLEAGTRVVTQGAFLLKSEGSDIEDSCGH